MFIQGLNEGAALSRVRLGLQRAGPGGMVIGSGAYIHHTGVYRCTAIVNAPAIAPRSR